MSMQWKLELGILQEDPGRSGRSLGGSCGGLRAPQIDEVQGETRPEDMGSGPVLQGQGKVGRKKVGDEKVGRLVGARTRSLDVFCVGINTTHLTVGVTAAIHKTVSTATNTSFPSSLPKPTPTNRFQGSVMPNTDSPSVSSLGPSSSYVPIPPPRTRPKRITSKPVRFPETG